MEESSSESSPEVSSSEELSSSPSQSSADVASPVSEDFLSFFDPSNRSSISISASDEVLSFISNYQNSKGSRYSDIYAPVDVTIHFNGQDYVYEEVGMRMKGNMSRAEFFRYGDIVCPVHFKLSFKATFDDPEYDDSVISSFKHDWSEDSKGRKKRKDRNFLGLEKLDLKYVPRNNGEMIVREPYVYKTFRDFGFFAPYSTLIDFTLSGESSYYRGTYQVVETIDKQFLKRRLSKAEAGGDLYKCTYNAMGKADFTRTDAINKDTSVAIPYGKIGVKDAWNYYHPVYELKTNDSNMQESDFSKMSNFIQSVWNCIYGNGTASELESVLDVRQFLSFSALSYLFGNFDDQRYNYNNFYLYFMPSDGRAIFIPYDWDWCLGLDLGYNMATLRPLDDWTLGGTNSNIYMATLFGDRLSYAQSDYLGYVRSYAPTALDPSAFSTLASELGYTSEVSSVTSYMNTKKNRVG